MKSTETNQIARLLVFARKGHTLYFNHVPNPMGYSNCHCTGYEDPDSFVKPYHWWSHPKDQLSTHFEGYQFADDGIPVIDNRQAVETDAGYRWVFKGPLVDVEIQDGECETLPEVDELFGSTINSAFGGLLTLNKATRITEKRGCLDSVSVKEYVQGWKEHGARIGRLFVKDGKATITWEA